MSVAYSQITNVLGNEDSTQFRILELAILGQPVRLASFIAQLVVRELSRKYRTLRDHVGRPQHMVSKT